MVGNLNHGRLYYRCKTSRDFVRQHEVAHPPMAHRILRRGYSYRRKPEVAGTRDQGQIFICYQRDLEAGFATIQRRLSGEALERYTLPFGGGYYFVLPGGGAFLGESMLAA